MRTELPPFGHGPNTPDQLPATPEPTDFPLTLAQAVRPSGTSPAVEMRGLPDGSTLVRDGAGNISIRTSEGVLAGAGAAEAEGGISAIDGLLSTVGRGGPVVALGAFFAALSTAVTGESAGGSLGEVVRDFPGARVAGNTIVGPGGEVLITQNRNLFGNPTFEVNADNLLRYRRSLEAAVVASKAPRPVAPPQQAKPPAAQAPAPAPAPKPTATPTPVFSVPPVPEDPRSADQQALWNTLTGLSNTRSLLFTSFSPGEDAKAEAMADEFNTTDRDAGIDARAAVLTFTGPKGTRFPVLVSSTVLGSENSVLAFAAHPARGFTPRPGLRPLRGPSHPHPGPAPGGHLPRTHGTVSRPEPDTRPPPNRPMRPIRPSDLPPDSPERKVPPGTPTVPYPKLDPPPKRPGVTDPAQQTRAEDAGDRFHREAAPLLTPDERQRWEEYNQRFPSIVREVAYAAHDATDAEKAEAARVLVGGAYGQDVVAWLRRGGFAGGPPPKTPHPVAAPGDEPSQSRIGGLTFPDNQVTNVSADEVTDARRQAAFTRYADTQTKFAQNYPVTAELARAAGVDLAKLVEVMRDNHLTASEALIRMGALPPTHWQDDPAHRNRFVTHRSAYATNNRYGDFAEQTAQAAKDLYARGVSSYDVARFIAENKQHFQIQQSPGSPPVSHYNNPASATQGLNPTVLVAESKPHAGRLGNPNYATAARAAVELVARHPELAQVFRLPPQPGEMPALGTLSELDANQAFAGREREGGVSADLVETLRSHLLHGEYDHPVLDGQAIRVPMQTPYGTGGAVYIVEIAQEASTAVVTPRGVQTQAAPGPERYHLEVIFDQGTAVVNRNGPRRQTVTRRANAAIDGLVQRARLLDKTDALRRLAGAWYDLSTTSGGFVGGGAGTNHIEIAAAYEQITGRPMPGLTGPADLYTVGLTRDEFIRLFMSGALFRNGPEAIRDAGANPDRPLPFQPPQFER